MMEFDDVINVILEYHYGMVKNLIKDCRQKNFIQLNDKAAAAREIIRLIVSKLPKEDQNSYNKLMHEKMKAYVKSIFIKTLHTKNKEDD